MNGVINVYKETGCTSFDVVAKVRKLFAVKRCGHLGTLDPMAEGVLPVCLGYATRFADYLSAADKEYIVQFKLGFSTDSFDSTGNILSENLTLKPDISEVSKVFSGFIGNITLKVPSYSAKKIDGVRAYKLARAGTIEDAGDAVMSIISCELLQYEYPYGLIKLACGKGTYVRSVIAKAGELLGCGAVMSGLLRSCNGVFKSNEAFKLDRLVEMKAEGRLSDAVISLNKLLNWGRGVVKTDSVKNIMNGLSPAKNAYLTLPLETEGDKFFIENTAGKLLAVGQRETGTNVPLKIIMVFK